MERCGGKDSKRGLSKTTIIQKRNRLSMSKKGTGQAEGDVVKEGGFKKGTGWE